MPTLFWDTAKRTSVYIHLAQAHQATTTNVCYKCEVFLIWVWLVLSFYIVEPKP